MIVAKLEIKSLISKLTPIDMNNPELKNTWIYLDEFLSYEIHNSHFIKATSSKAYIRDIWDGRDHLFKTKNGTFPTGLLPEVIGALKEYGVEYETVDYRPAYDKDTTSPFELSPELELREYQDDAVVECINAKRGVIWARPRSGKTIMEIILVQKLNIFPVLSICQSIDVARQTLAKFKQFLPGAEVGLIGDGECDIKPITIATIQSLAASYNVKEKWPKKSIEITPNQAKKIAIRKLVESAKVVWIDECFPKGTKILTDTDKYMRIEDIINQRSVTHVLSYNESLKKVERLKIIRKITVKRSRNLVKIKINVDGDVKTLRCTSNHKIWTERGYIPAYDIVPGDIVKYLGSFDTAQSVTWLNNLKIMGRRRRGKNNPVFRHPGTIEKISKSRKAAFDKLPDEEKKAQILRFRNAPKYKGKMTKPEKIVNDLKLENLLYVGNGKYNNSPYMYEIDDPKILGRKKWKIPDFIVKDTNKVVEVADREYWHTEEEMENVVKNYAKVEIKCLLLYADEILQHPIKTKRRLFTFIHNHLGTVIEVTKSGNTDIVYNLEVEKNHNYFANGILVSNCHHAVTTTHKLVLQNKIYSAEYILGCSGTPFREDNTNLLMTGLIGPIIYEINYSRLIADGFLIRPTIHLIKLPKRLEIVKGSAYSTIYKQAISENEERNGIIARIVMNLVNRNKTCMVLVNKITHGKLLEQMIPSAEFSYSASKNREQLWARLRERLLPCLITTLGDEGVDIPSLDATIVAAGGKSAIKVFQRLRCITPFKGKEHAIVVDFMDPYKYLSSHSNRRAQLYKSEPSFIINYKKVTK